MQGRAQKNCGIGFMSKDRLKYLILTQNVIEKDLLVSCTECPNSTRVGGGARGHPVLCFP